jgi:hypothetical protein
VPATQKNKEGGSGFSVQGSEYMKTQPQKSRKEKGKGKGKVESEK